MQAQPSGDAHTGLTSAMADLNQSASSTAAGGDVDMQNAEASADSASSPITQQVRTDDFACMQMC